MCFNIGEDLARNYETKQLKFDGQFFLAPTPLATELGDILSYYIEITLHHDA
jgi:hypothetical protein